MIQNATDSTPATKQGFLRSPSAAMAAMFTLIILVLGVSFALIYRNTIRLVAEDAWVAHTYQTIAHIEAIQTTLIDIETGQRGFVIAGDPSFLEPYENGLKQVDKLLREIRELTADNDRQRALLLELQPLIRRKVEISQNIIHSRQADGAIMAATIIAGGEGKQVMDEIRATINRMMEEERRLLMIRSDSSRKTAEQTNIEFMIIALIDLSATLLALWVVYTNTHKTRVALGELTREQARLEAETREAAIRIDQARIATERAALFKDEFLRNVYHELRTPLTSILGYSALLNEEPRLDKETREASEAIHQNGTHLLKLLENLLHIGESLRGGQPPPAQPLPVLPVLRRALNRLQPAIDAKSIDVRVDENSTNPTVSMDGERLQSALEQVIDNAVKFSAPKGEVRIEVKPVNGQIEIAVIDKGPGIPKELLPKLFTAFHQGDGSISRTHGGLGTGLFVARFLAETYGGSLRAESPGQGQGSRFVMTLPKPKE